MHPLPLVTYDGREIVDKFNPEDPKNMGRPTCFDIKLYAANIEQLICADDIQTAIHLLENPPSWYRENYPEELSRIRTKLYQNMYDQIEYGTDDEEAECTKEFGEEQWLGGKNEAYTFPRAQILTERLKQLNAHLVVPWIYDLGSSHGNLPLGLKKHDVKFNYLGRGINHRINQKLKEWCSDIWAPMPKDGQYSILCCFETIEHCTNPHDIVHSAHKLGVKFHEIFLSVPHGTLGGGLPNWKTRRLGHVRTWTKDEFLTWADFNFKGYKWDIWDSHSMVLRGEMLINLK